MRLFKLAAAAYVALLTQPAWSAGVTKIITRPDGSKEEVTVLVPEEQAKALEGRGFSRSNAFDTIGKAKRYRDEACEVATRPSWAPNAPAPVERARNANRCDDANRAIAEWK